MEYSSVVGMSGADRRWYLARLHKQLKQESEAIKNANSK